MNNFGRILSRKRVLYELFGLFVMGKLSAVNCGQLISL